MFAYVELKFKLEGLSREMASEGNWKNCRDLWTCITKALKTFVRPCSHQHSDVEICVSYNLLKVSILDNYVTISTRLGTMLNKKKIDNVNNSQPLNSVINWKG